MRWADERDPNQTQHQKTKIRDKERGKLNHEEFWEDYSGPGKVGEMSATWPCEHQRTKGYISCEHEEVGHQEKICTAWNFCPICGAKRPDQPKTLSEKLRESMNTFTLIKRDHPDTYQSRLDITLAQAAYEHFSEILDRECVLDWEPLKNKMRASL